MNGSSQRHSAIFAAVSPVTPTLLGTLGWLAKDKGYPIKNVMLVYSNYEAGQLVNAALKERLPKLGFNIVGEVPLDIKAADQTAAMLRIRSMKPDATAGLVTPRDGTLLHQARFSLNYNDAIFFGGTAGFSDTVLWKDLGDQIGKAVLTRNLFGMTGFSPAAKLESVRNIVQELKEKANLKIEVGQGAIQGAQAPCHTGRAPPAHAPSPARRRARADGLRRELRRPQSA